MAEAREDTEGGLRVERYHGSGWIVVHAGSGLRAINPLRYKRDALAARRELLATGVDFTKKKSEIHKDPGFSKVRKIYAAWNAKRIDRQHLSAGTVMVFMAQRTSDGLIHITNTLGGHIGQHHVHDEASFEDWKNGKPSAGANPMPEDSVQWLPADTKDCTCGQPVWRCPQ